MDADKFVKVLLLGILLRGLARVPQAIRAEQIRQQTPIEQTSKWDSYESTVPSPEMLMTPSEREEYLNDL